MFTKTRLRYSLITACLTAFVAVAAPSSKHITIAELRRVRLPDVKLETVESVSPDVKKDPHAAAHVRVTGVIGGHIRFELLLPEKWNGRFVMGGGGGFVGTVQNGARDCVNRGYATVGTDTGHSSQGIHADWAYTNVEAQLNFGYLAVHRTAEVAKTIIHDWYGNEPAYSYFVGCSRGGGQAMMESQRYPDDFNGIVAGAPAFDWPGLSAMAVAIAKVLYPDPAHLDKNPLDREALVRLQQSIIEQCDAQDGLKDGVVQDPGSAHFDSSKVPGLTDQQRKCLEAIYAGARFGNELIYPGYPPAAECDPNQWIAWITGPVPPLVASDRAPDLMFAFGTQILKYFVFDDPKWNYATYDFAHFKDQTRLAASFLNATNPDLHAFKTRMGRLIIWHGWADTALPAQATINYYRAVLAHDPQAADYCRLFMVPGCLHCGGGPGASEVDWLAVISEWVELGRAPEKVIATKRDQGKVLFTRPLVKYPEIAVYGGTGDTNRAASFVIKDSPAR